RQSLKADRSKAVPSSGRVIEAHQQEADPAPQPKPRPHLSQFNSRSAVATFFGINIGFTFWPRFPTLMYPHPLVGILTDNIFYRKRKLRCRLVNITVAVAGVHWFEGTGM